MKLSFLTLGFCLALTAVARADEPAIPRFDQEALNRIGIGKLGVPREELAVPKLELRDGDRVVFLGNTLIEREQKYGYWETMLTARHPDRNITFRNLGWDGDTVWAESRGYFDAPQVGYQRLLDHIRELRPTVIFLGYGNNEAFAGKEGLPAFIAQYNKLLDDLTKASADGVRFVILSPLPREWFDGVSGNPREYNKRLAPYADAIESLATRRQFPYIDLARYVATVQQLRDQGRFVKPLTSDGMHLTESGYKQTAGWISANWLGCLFICGANLKANGTTESAFQLQVPDIRTTKGGLSFTLVADSLPLDELGLCIRGLMPGQYTLLADGRTIRTARSDEWAASQYMTSDPNLEQVEALRRAIIAKNRLYFHHWRPQNITYLFGFRKHEQGQNAKEVFQFDPLVAGQEDRIRALRSPVEHVYELTPEESKAP